MSVTLTRRTAVKVPGGAATAEAMLRRRMLGASEGFRVIVQPTRQAIHSGQRLPLGQADGCRTNGHLRNVHPGQNGSGIRTRDTAPSARSAAVIAPATTFVEETFVARTHLGTVEFVALPRRPLGALGQWEDRGVCVGFEAPRQIRTPHAGVGARPRRARSAVAFFRAVSIAFGAEIFADCALRFVSLGEKEGGEGEIGGERD